MHRLALLDGPQFIDDRPHGLICSRNEVSHCVLNKDGVIALTIDPSRVVALQFKSSNSALTVPATASPTGGFVNYELHGNAG